MNLNILNNEVQDYINSNYNLPVSKLLLKGVSFDGVSVLELAQQIESKLKSKSKLPTWFSTKNIYYPPKLNLEQTSSEQTASYKSTLISGFSIIDLTGGFGVDCFYFSKHFQKVVHCEINKELSKIAAHNFIQLNLNNVKTIDKNGIDFLVNSTQKFDWIYLDPSRRHETKGKVFFLKDCIPNVPENLYNLFNFSENIMVKTSPLLDLSIGIDELNYVKEIHVIAVKNEVKELLWILKKNYKGDIRITTINILKNSSDRFSFNISEKENVKVSFSKPLNYLYEPNSAIMKSGAFQLISQKFRIYKLHQHSHLYTSEDLIDFPGRCFKIDDILSYNKKEFKKAGLKKANVTARNFNDSVQQIRKKLSIKDGGEVYLFFTTDLDGGKIVLKCSKISRVSP